MPSLQASVTDNFAAIVAESTYGTSPGAFNRMVPVMSETFTPEIQEVGTSSYRPDRQTNIGDQTTQVPVGGTGTLEMLLPNSGSFLMCRDLLDVWTAALATVSNASGLRKFTAKSDGTGPRASTVSSLSILVGRADQNQARRETIYSGAMVTDWSLSAAVGAPVSLAVNYDWVTRTTRTPSSNASYTPPSLSKKVQGPWYTWRDLTVTVGGVQIPVVTDLTITGNRGLDTTLYKLGGTAVKDQPRRSTVPTYSVALTCRLDSTTSTLREKWGNDGLTGAMVITLTGRSDQKTGGTSPIYTSFTFTFADAKVMGSEAASSLDGMSTIALMLDPVDPYDGSSTAVQLDIVGAQTAID